MRYDLAVIPRILREQLLPGINSHQAVFLSAGSGWGKAVSVTKLLKCREYSYFSLNKTPLRDCVSKKTLVVLDDLEALSAAEERELFDMLQSAPHRRRQLADLRPERPGHTHAGQCHPAR